MWELRWALYLGMATIPLTAVYVVLRDGGDGDDVATAAIVSSLVAMAISAPLILIIHRWAGRGRGR